MTILPAVLYFTGLAASVLALRALARPDTAHRGRVYAVASSAMFAVTLAIGVTA